MIDAARRASAYKIIVVMPYYGYSRQDRKDRPRVAIGSKLVANMLVALAVSIGDCDFHGDSPLSTKKPHLPTRPQHFYYTTRTAAAQGPNLHKSDAATL